MDTPMPSETQQGTGAVVTPQSPHTNNPTAGTGGAPAQGKVSGRIAAWLLLVLCGGTSWSLSVAHALTLSGGTGQWIAFLVGTVPVACVAILSHMAGEGSADGWDKAITWFVLLLAFCMSLPAQAETVATFMEDPLNYVFPVATDMATIVGLRRLMAIGRQKRGQQDGHVATSVGHGQEPVAMAKPVSDWMAIGRETVARPAAEDSVDKVAKAPAKKVTAKAPDLGKDTGQKGGLDAARLVIMDSPAISYTELATAIGCSARTARRHLATIKAEKEEMAMAMAMEELATSVATSVGHGHVATDR